MAAEAALTLWNMIDDPNPSVPDPELGVSNEASELARLGRGNAKLSIEISTSVAYGNWRSQTRIRLRHGGNMGQMYQSYYEEVSACRRRYEARVT